MKTIFKFLIGLVLLLIILITYICYVKIIRERFIKLYNENYPKYKAENTIKLKDDYRNIFCYWDTENLPPLINECIKKIKKEMGKNWNVILLNKNTALELVPNDKFPKKYNTLSVQAKTDWLRLYLLKNYGGVWMDISIVLNDPQEIEDIYNTLMKTNKDVCVYEMDFHRIKVNGKEYPGIESWFIMAKPNSELITKWLEEFEYAIEIGFDKYTDYIIRNNYILSDGTRKNEYLTVYRCIQVVMQKYDMNLSDVYVKDAKKTMYKIMQNPQYLLKNKCTHNIKLAHYDRDYLNGYLEKFIGMYF